MFGRIINKNQKSTTIFKDGKRHTLLFKSKHNTGDIIDSQDTLLTQCKNPEPLKKLTQIYNYYNKKLSFIEEIKEFLKKRGYREVLTKKLKREIIKEPNINYIKTPYGYLASSPELELKKLLCLGFDKLFELNFAYRDDLEDNLHRKEFLILEWYRTLSSPEDINKELIELIKHLNGGNTISYNGLLVNLDKIEYITYRELFSKYLSIDIESADTSRLKAEFGVEGTEDRLEILDAIFSLHIQKHLGVKHPTVVYSFPKERAALARVSGGWALRYELYIATLELSNCYLEETDVEIIKNRFKTLDKSFLSALEFGMPPTSGIAVGVERLFMLLNNLNTIEEPQW